MQITVRNLTTWLVAKLLIMLGLVRYATKRVLNEQCILSIYFHNPSREDFERCIKWLKKNNFHFLSTSDLDRIIRDNLPFPRGGVLLTVDDGWQSNERNVIAIANKYCIPVTIFIATSPVEDGIFWWSYHAKCKSKILKSKFSLKALTKMSNEERLLRVEEMKKVTSIKRDAMTIEQVKNLITSQYITIGAHTHTHPILINCDEDEVRREIQICKQKLESWIGKEIAYFAYPNGDYGKREIQILKELNFRLAFSTQSRYLTPAPLKDPYSLPRFCFVEGASFAENICRMVGIWKFSKEWLKQINFKGQRVSES